MTQVRIRSCLLFTLTFSSLLTAGCVSAGRTTHPDAVIPITTCPTTPAPEIRTKASIGWQEIPNADLLVKAQRTLETCMPNARISWIKMNSGGDVIQALGAGSLDLAQVGSAPAVKAISKPLSLDVRVLWLHDQIGTAEALAARDPAIRRVQDLSGKRVGVPFGSTAHFSLLTTLDSAGLSGKVQVVNLTPDAIRGAWQRREIDAAWVWEPSLSTLLTNGHIIASGEDSSKAGAATFDLEVATSDFVEQNPEFIRIWGIAQGSATNVLRDPTPEAITLLADELASEPEAVSHLMKGYRYPSAQNQLSETYFGGGLTTILSETGRFLQSQGSIQRTTPDIYGSRLEPLALRSAAEEEK